MLDIARNFSDWRFYSFEDCGLAAKPGETIANWTQLPKDTPLHEAYGAIDVAFIPITSDGRGARYQLPAKLVDAMSFGKCIVASSTPAIGEFADGCYIELPADASPEDANEALRLALEANLGARAYEVFTKLLTPAAAALELTALLQRSGRRCEL
jgi:glycosyltransferase involved in cell wall biosynthesis